LEFTEATLDLPGKILRAQDVENCAQMQVESQLGMKKSGSARTARLYFLKALCALGFSSTQVT